MIVACCLALASQPTFGLSGLFCDNLVLQRSEPDPIFGTAPPGSSVKVTIGQKVLTAEADLNGNWQVLTPEMEPGPAFSIDVASGGQTVTLHNVKVGEVWLASGQSNMEFTESEADDYEQAKANSNPDIRFFTVKDATSETPTRSVKGSWVSSSPNTVGHFSAVALSFARELSDRLQCPIGVINSSWGGTPAEAWISREALSNDPVTKTLVQKFNSDLTVYPARKAAYDLAMQMWIDGKKGGENQGYLNGWFLQTFNDQDWKTVHGGQDTHSILNRDFQGSVWYRKTVIVPEEWFGKRLKLSLGALADYDSTYFNGVRVGYTGQSTANPSAELRNYLVAPGILHRGPNQIAIRIFSSSGDAGMRGPSDEMKLSLVDDTASIPLDGNWKFSVEQEIDPDTPRPHLPNGPGNPTSPSELFNAMIAPLIPFRIKGAIWYQGESNAGNAALYQHLFPELIQDWRWRWQEGSFPFYFVQLPNYLARKQEPGDSSWANLREAQTKALSLPNTGMAVAIDLGKADTIHPANKREVGKRLSLWALQFAYRLPTAYASPTFRSLEIKDDHAIVSFRNGSLITTDGTAPSGFAIAGSDHKFHWAKAILEGSTVTLTSPDVPHPIAVRYAWADNPAVNLVNLVGLPAAPFRTDDWPLVEDLK